MQPSYCGCCATWAYGEFFTSYDEAYDLGDHSPEAEYGQMVGLCAIGDSLQPYILTLLHVAALEYYVMKREDEGA